MLYSKYANPKEFMSMYIEDGRFGEFVANILNMEYERKQEDLQKDDDWKLWVMYVHSAAEESFINWKKRVLGTNNNKACGDENLTDESIKGIIDELFPE